MNLESVMVIADEVDENLYLASRNLANVLVVEPRYADPVSLVRLQESARHQGRDRQTQGDVRMSTLKFDEGRLMQVLVAPIVSEKATMVAEKNNAGDVQGAAGRHQARDQGRCRADVQGRGQGRSVVNTKGKTKRFGRPWVAATTSQGLRDAQAGSRAEPFRGGCVIMAVVKMKPTLARPPCRGEGYA
jgi:large subunit ribosomal protein L23